DGLPAEQLVIAGSDAVYGETSRRIRRHDMIQGAILAPRGRRDQNDRCAWNGFSFVILDDSFNRRCAGLEDDPNRVRRIETDVEARIQDARALQRISKVKIRRQASSCLNAVTACRHVDDGKTAVCIDGHWTTGNALVHAKLG